MSGDQLGDLSKRPLATPARGSVDKPEEDAPSKPVNLTREKPILHRQCDNHVRKLTNDLKKSVSVADAAAAAYRTHPEQLKTGDRALLSLARVLQFRHETGVRCLGSVTDILQLVPDASLTRKSSGEPAGGAAAPQASPQSSSITARSLVQALMRMF